jgi:serine/threonine protein kinase/tetratricopeptide (TPR) repeat protein
VDDDKTESEHLDPTETVRPDSPDLPERVGAYRILERLGEGGMGVVYLAEQTEPVRRRVALKVIKHGMDTKRVVARFEAERQALAMMDHPCVAKVYDAGSTEGGRPYFAMEYVQGVPITEHCDRQRLTTRERLELFQQVCEGVQHAHQNAIIHRDLKPSNVLVSYQDEKATPKIIDFGVAKAIHHRLTEKTVYTEMGVLIGTPEYMSPEQAEMTGQNVDTRTDVYSLGVMLYELLVGALPFESKELREAGFDEVRRKIREEEPSKPSARLSTLKGERSTESARMRRTELPSLRRDLAGDLDWITMKALEKDRARRYGSPHELAADLKRYLMHEPVSASPPSASYRAKKFVRRNRVAVSFAAVVTLLLVGFAATMAVQAQRIAGERDRANQEADTANRVSELMTRMFEIVDPSVARGNEVTARQILEQGTRMVERRLQDEPQIRARMMVTIGKTYHSLGLLDPAKKLLGQAVEILEAGSDANNAMKGEALFHLGLVDFARENLYSVDGTYDSACKRWEAALRLQRSALPPDHPDLAATLSALGWVHAMEGDYEPAARYAGEAHPIWTSRPDTADWRASLSAMALSFVAFGRGDYEEMLTFDDYAVEVFERAQEREEYWPGQLAPLTNAAFDYREAGRLEESVRLYERAIEHNERLFGRNHASVVDAYAGLSQTLLLLGDIAGAYEHRRRVTEFREANLDQYARSYMLLGSRLQLAHLAMRLGRSAEARAAYTKAVDSYRQGVSVRAVVSEWEAKSHAELAALVADSGSPEDALPLFEIASLSAERHPLLRAGVHRDHAALLRHMGHGTEAAEHEARAAELDANAAVEADP